MLNNKTVLVTGGTGSFGRRFTEFVLTHYKPEKLIIFSRDEFKQHEMSKAFPQTRYPAIRYFLGDIRDKDRLYRAFKGVDFVIHAAALKQVPALEYNPGEAVKTNINGAENIVNAALDCGVKKVIALSTDKAVNPINLYGATKLAAEKIFIAANAYGGQKVKFSIVRYGNVSGSRGSVLNIFSDLKQKNRMRFPITDRRMTRFWITLEESVRLALRVLNQAMGGEIFVPILPSFRIIDLAKAVEPKSSFEIIGIRPGEKIHETLVSEDEARNTKAFGNTYVILPHFFERTAIHRKYDKFASVPASFAYRSDTNKRWLATGDLKKKLKEMDIE